MTKVRNLKSVVYGLAALAVLGSCGNSKAGKHYLEAGLPLTAGLIDSTGLSSLVAAGYLDTSDLENLTLHVINFSDEPAATVSLHDLRADYAFMLESTDGHFSFNKEYDQRVNNLNGKPDFAFLKVNGFERNWWRKHGLEREASKEDSVLALASQKLLDYAFSRAEAKGWK
ncbi:hypothetical protein HYT57_04640 [Candidatus Woesearchaeota archaeon]|nr:hypothetical protein [Candidatus Woesearchaeota archaeon]